MALHSWNFYGTRMALASHSHRTRMALAWHSHGGMALVAPIMSCREDVLDRHLEFRTAAPSDLQRVHSLEEAGYPTDEAASLDSLTYRIHQASSVFLVATLGSELVGFVCGTQTAKDELDHASMFTHDPQGRTLCIHSVCVGQEYRRQGIGLRLLKAYIKHVSTIEQPRLHSIRLLCKKPLIGLYEKAGFCLVGPSSVVHGRDPWFECVHIIQRH
ncbi:unnamed protein product [Closterium sp. NIES-54]